MSYILKVGFEFKADDKNLEKFIEILETITNSEEIISGDFEFIEMPE